MSSLYKDFAETQVIRALIFCLLLAGNAQSRADGENRAAIEALFSSEAYVALERRWGADGRQRVVAWHDLLLRLNAVERAGELANPAATNDFFNAVPWLTDLEHWGKEDYWATPMETLASNGGDCEDFSIGKYFSLRLTGVDEGKLRLTYVKSLTYNQAHMVLAYYDSPEAEPLILDNINKSILPASQRQDLLPIYGFNAEGLWLAKSRRSLEAGGGLSQWKDLLRRIHGKHGG